MKFKSCVGISFLLAAFAIFAARASRSELVAVPGLKQSVEILTDPWGVSHIYAQNQDDLFFAQGLNAARHRLFQLELWRRQATGSMAEIQGEKAIERDTGARLLKFRGDMDQELAHYHPQGKAIITSFVRGYNAYVELTAEYPGLLPLEFHLLGIKPEKWSSEIVISRHNGLFRNAEDELSFVRLVDHLGSEELKELLFLTPGDPDLLPHKDLDLALFPDGLLEFYKAARSPVKFSPEDLPDPAHRAPQPVAALSRSPFSFLQPPDAGSNNWVVSGRHTFTGHPFMANDPHRTQQVPSLRYWVHLAARGWDVMGGGEPALPGVSIGHNQHGAWGLTIFSVDQEDLYVYETDPRNPLLYRYRGQWEEMKVIHETIPVKGKPPVRVDLKFTRHGPVLYEDHARHKAYALRAAWLETGGAPYLASLRVNQARNWEEFREALSYFHTPSENLVWADREGNIGWQAVGITPIRRGWNGLLPVPGDGRFEWDGFLPIKALPAVLNPPEGFFATANQNNLPAAYPFPVGFLWTEPFRFSRIQEFLGTPRHFTMMDMMRLQHDVLSIPARSLVPLLKGLRSSDPAIQKALELLLSWNFRMEEDSTAAAIYMVWERKLAENVWNLRLPEKTREIFKRRSLTKLIGWLTAPDHPFGDHPTEGRDALLLKSLEQAIEKLKKRFGPDMKTWRYGHEKLHHIVIRHPLSEAVTPEIRRQLEAGPVPRPGNAYTVNMTNSTGG